MKYFSKNFENQDFGRELFRFQPRPENLAIFTPVTPSCSTLSKTVKLSQKKSENYRISVGNCPYFKIISQRFRSVASGEQKKNPSRSKLTSARFEAAKLERLKCKFFAT